MRRTLSVGLDKRIGDITCANYIFTERKPTSVQPGVSVRLGRARQDAFIPIDQSRHE